MQELVGKNLNNIVGNLWQRQENEGSGSSHGNIVSRDFILLYSLFLKFMKCVSGMENVKFLFIIGQMNSDFQILIKIICRFAPKEAKNF